ncbi:MAG: efflux RND transporter periplasmic adaptor subunit [Rubrivivax sp.]
MRSPVCLLQSRSLLPCRRPAPLALLATALLAGCGPGTPAGGAAGAGASTAAATGASAASAPALPPVSVTTVVARRRDLPVTLDATGSVVPEKSVEVRPQLTSVITQVHVREGQFVKRGDALFTLDARSDEANVARLQAQLAKDQAALADAQRQLSRSRELLAQNFISQGAVDSNTTLVESAQAAVAADRAAIDAARVPLAYARIAAPSAGRVGAINVFPGTAVQANVTPLLTVTQLDPIGVSFAVPQRHLADLLAALKSGDAKVSATLGEGGGTLVGRLDFVDNGIDAASGTVRAKAKFDNPKQQLWPGAFVRASLTVRTLEQAVVLPQAVIIQSTRGSIVYVVADGKAAVRPVQVLAVQGDDAAVSGLKGGERVVLDGRQNLRPGAPVVERPREGGRGASGVASGAASGGAGRAASAASMAEGKKAVQP